MGIAVQKFKVQKFKVQFRGNREKLFTVHRSKAGGLKKGGFVKGLPRRTTTNSTAQRMAIGRGCFAASSKQEW